MYDVVLCVVCCLLSLGVRSVGLRLFLCYGTRKLCALPAAKAASF